MSARGLVGVLALAMLALVALAPRPVPAHGLHPGVLTLVEQQPGVFSLAFTEPVDTSGTVAAVDVVLPVSCRREAERLDCTPGGLQGTIALRGGSSGRARVLTLVRFLDGRTIEAMLTEDAPTLVVEGAPGRSAWAWLSLGVEHVLGGLDHLAFVLGLLLVVGVQSLRRLVATITAFTLAHSLTLALAATGTLVLATAPVEATIAASVVLVAREATHERPTLTRRAPWVVALVFGLVHGLGFAGALAAWGLPEGWLVPSLLCFNLGVELGQLVVVGIVVIVVRVLGRRHAPLRRVAAYAIGGLAAWWLVERTLVIVMAGS
jgi:HupE / UreJ protein